MRARWAIAALAAALCFPASAVAAGPDASPTPTGTPPDPTDPPVTATPTPVPPKPKPPEPKPKRVRAKLKLRTAHTLADGKRRVVVSGRSFDVRGTLTPYVRHERVELWLFRDGKRVKTLRPRMHRGKRGHSARFEVTIRRRTAAHYAVRAIHRRTRRMAYSRSNKERVTVLGADIRWGHGGPAVRLLQRGLRRLHYAAPHSGVYDDATSRAVMAWRKVTGRARVYSADRGVLLAVLDGKGAWRVRHPHDGHHVEADISRQVLALIDGRRVVRIQHMSSGKPSTPTVLGRFHVYRKDLGYNSLGMLDSSYFIRGYAIHGYHDVPTYNASHGCLRVPLADAAAIYSWVRIGDVVWVEP